MKFRFLIFSTLLIVLVTSTSLALTQTSKSIPSFGTISAPSPSAHFGVNVQYYDDAEVQTYFPDLWTLVEYTGATHLIGAPRKEWVDEAAKHGIKIMITFGACWGPDSEIYQSVYSSKEKMKAHLDMYNIPQYRDHSGIWAYNICCEPFNNWDSTTDNFVSVLLYGIQYIRSLDPTHPVTIQLCPAGAWSEDSAGTYIEKRKQWISRFIDDIDFLTYNYYRFTTEGTQGGSGTEYWRDVNGFRNALVKQLDQVLIPASKGKQIVIGETGCPTGATGYGTTFTEEQQAEYFRIYGEETRKRDIFVCVYRLIEPYPGTEGDYGIFRVENDGHMNIPRIAASLVKDYLSIS